MMSTQERVMTREQAREWRKKTGASRYQCSTCDFKTNGPQVIGKHWNENPDHRTDKQRLKFLSNKAERLARDRIEEHNANVVKEYTEGQGKGGGVPKGYKHTKKYRPRHKNPDVATKDEITRSRRQVSNHSANHKFCTHCGGPRTGSYKFCAHCGYRLA